MPSLVLLAGIPASGKSTYGRWLETEHGFWHVDAENATPDEVDVVATWWRLCHGAASVNEVVDAPGRPVVIDWGFPPHVYDWVLAVKAAGVAVWWFDGDRAAAREAFIKRATVPVELLDIQMSSLMQYWPQIEPIVSSSTIETIRTDGSYVSPEAIFALMFGTPPGRHSS
jgi:hypothetical protein